MISFQESMQKLAALVFEPIGVQKLCLGACEGRVLAEDIVAQCNSPEY